MMMLFTSRMEKKLLLREKDRSVASEKESRFQIKLKVGKVLLLSKIQSKKCHPIGD